MSNLFESVLVTSPLPRIDERKRSDERMREALVDARNGVAPTIKLSEFYRGISHCVRESDWPELREAIVEMMLLEEEIFDDVFRLRESGERKTLLERYVRVCSFDDRLKLQERGIGDLSPEDRDFYEKNIDRFKQSGGFRPRDSYQQRLKKMRRMLDGERGGMLAKADRMRAAEAPTEIAPQGDAPIEVQEEVADQVEQIVAEEPNKARALDKIKGLFGKIKNHYGPVALQTIKAAAKPVLKAAGMGAAMAGVLALGAGLLGAAPITLPVILAAVGAGAGAAAAGAFGSGLVTEFAAKQQQFFEAQGDAENAEKWKMIATQGFAKDPKGKRSVGAIIYKALSVIIPIAAGMLGGAAGGKLGFTIGSKVQDMATPLLAKLNDVFTKMGGPKVDPKTAQDSLKKPEAQAAAAQVEEEAPQALQKAKPAEEAAAKQEVAAAKPPATEEPAAAKPAEKPAAATRGNEPHPEEAPANRPTERSPQAARNEPHADEAPARPAQAAQGGGNPARQTAPAAQGNVEQHGFQRVNDSPEGHAQYMRTRSDGTQELLISGGGPAGGNGDVLLTRAPNGQITRQQANNGQWEAMPEPGAARPATQPAAGGMAIPPGQPVAPATINANIANVQPGTNAAIRTTAGGQTYVSANTPAELRAIKTIPGLENANIRSANGVVRVTLPGSPQQYTFQGTQLVPVS